MRRKIKMFVAMSVFMISVFYMFFIMPAHSAPYLHDFLPLNDTTLRNDPTYIWKVNITNSTDFDFNTTNTTIIFLVPGDSDYTSKNMSCYGTPPEYLCNITSNQMGLSSYIDNSTIKYYFEAWNSTPIFGFGVNGTLADHYIATIQTPPIYSSNSTNSTMAGTDILFNLHWADEPGYSTLSKGVISLFNGSSWVNSTWCDMAGVREYDCNKTLRVNSTAQHLWWKAFANDTANNWNMTQNFSLFTVYNPNLTVLSRCEAGIDNEIAVFRMTDEGNQSNTSASMDMTITVYTSSSVLNISLSFPSNSTHRLCTSDVNTNYTVDILAQYTGTGYSTRSYNWYRKTLNATSEDIKLYLLESSSSTAVKFTVTDSDSNPIENAYVEIKKFYISNGTFATVAVGKTDSNGKTLSYVKVNDVYYEIDVREAGVLKKTVTMGFITGDMTIMINPTEPIEFFNYYDSITHSCSYNATTQLLACIVNDTGGRLLQTCLQAQKMGALTYTDIAGCGATNCMNGTNVYLTCNLTNVTGASYVYTLTGIIRGSETWHIFAKATQELINNFLNLFGNCGDPLNINACREGALMAFIVIGTATFVGLSISPSIGILMEVATIGLTIWIGLYAITTLTLVGFIFMAVLVIYRMRSSI